MTAFIRSLCLSALLAAGAAWAQQQSDNSSNPHSTTAKDKQSTGTSSSSTNQQLDRAEQANPHHPQNKDRETTGQTTAMADKDQMSDMDHDAMMKNATPQQMLQKLHMANLHEIEMAKLAEQNGTDKVKSFAQTIERDHQDADQKVQSLAQKKNITLSDTMKAKNPEMQQKMDQAKQHFQGLKGQEFDR